MTDDFTQSILCIEAMLQKERSSYKLSDYLNDLPEHVYGERPVDAPARDAIANWFVKIVELCHYNLETAAIAVSILDRFAATPNAKDVLINREVFQLASLASIYTAVKIHEREALSPKFIAKLSGGLNTKEDIERMEFRILKALKWQVNPPTSVWFARNFLCLIADDVFDNKLIMDLVQYQVSFSVTNYDFCTERPSEVALAALLNAVEGLYDDKLCPRRLQALICKTLRMQPKSLDELRRRLCGATYHEAVSEILQRQGKEKRIFCKPIYIRERSETPYTISPKCVAARS